MTNKRFYLQNICLWNDEPANISICIGKATHKVPGGEIRCRKY